MKITTWNVNGLRAVIGKGFHQWAQRDASDVFCLQEIKARPEQIEADLREIPGYQSFWNPAQRPGYSGVASFIRLDGVNVQYGIGVEEFDSEGRVIRMDLGQDVLLYNIYFPNGQRSHDRVDYKLAFYKTLLNQCALLHAQGKQIIITGDFNTAHNDIDLANPKQNAKTSGFLPEERVWIDTYLENGFTDAYRKLYPERVEYTWWTYISNARQRNVGWRLDYYLVSDDFMPRVKDVVIQTDVYGSDHCPVSLIWE
ncbi:exodeoxyribonuclease III [Longilinea arvoryzae]|uniref:Exodeoxyribonuclease III n=1 Tax=Longilinea arvoryzae TaxID=360412 RepID=A0A0S7BLB9_9CHLR|nr:exodeoxyribonuclease III [Longilinea arvoryzae]GAP14721.1 exodeoxyribonuclease III [Longilinea arvoryzae]